MMSLNIKINQSSISRVRLVQNLISQSLQLI